MTIRQFKHEVRKAITDDIYVFLVASYTTRKKSYGTVSVVRTGDCEIILKGRTIPPTMIKVSGTEVT
jgi:hypothetical protein